MFNSKIKLILLSVLFLFFSNFKLYASTDQKLPTGAGASTQFTPSAGSNWQNVDDTIGAPNDDTDYNSTPSNRSVYLDLFTFTAFSVPAGSTISQVKLYWRVKETTGGGSANVNGTLRVNGTNYHSTGQATGSLAWNDFTGTWTTNPDTGAAWTVNDVNGTGSNPLQQFGYRKNDAGFNTAIRMTQIYIEVTYTAASGGTKRALIGVGN